MHLISLMLITFYPDQGSLQTLWGKKMNNGKLAPLHGSIPDGCAKDLLRTVPFSAIF